MFLSFVITTYNRKDIVSCAIDSVLDQIKEAGDCEIIIVDDASTDGTQDYLASKYCQSIEIGIIKIKFLNENLGVTGAKNAGYEHACGQWVIFLDSDDKLLPKILSSLLSTLYFYQKNPIIFFRCINQNFVFVGKKFSSDRILRIDEYVRHSSYGEALTAINKRLIKTAPYPADLRGYEGLGCCRIILAHGNAVLSTVVARIYVQDRCDRLSVSQGFLERLLPIAKGHWLMFKEFRKMMPLKLKIAYLVKIVLYSVVGYIYRVSRRNE